MRLRTSATLRISTSFARQRNNNHGSCAASTARRSGSCDALGSSNEADAVTADPGWVAEYWASLVASMEQRNAANAMGWADEVNSILASLRSDGVDTDAPLYLG